MLRIIAGGVELDTFPDEKLNINYAVENILDITKRKTDWTRNFRLPGTNTNVKFFRNLQDPSVTTGINLLTSTETRILINDNEVLRGSLRLLNSRKANDGVVFNVEVIGTLRGVFNAGENLSLSDIDFSHLNHIRNRDSIINSWSNSKGYVYPYILNGQNNDVFNAEYIWNLFPALFAKDIIDKGFQTLGITHDGFFKQDYFSKLIIPWTRENIQNIDELEAQRTSIIGLETETLSIARSSDGGVFSNDNYHRLTPIRRVSTGWWGNTSTMLNHMRLNDTDSIVVETANDLQFSDTLDTWKTRSINFNTDAAGSFLGGQYECRASGLYDIRFIGHVFPQYFHSDGSFIEYNDQKLGFEYQYQLIHQKNNGSSVVIDQTPETQFFNPGNKKIYSSSVDEDPNIPNMQPWRLSAQRVFLEVGERVFIRYYFRFPSLNFKGPNDRVTCRLLMKRVHNGEFTKLKVSPSENRTFGDELVNMNQALPSDVTFKDLLLEFVKMFNLIIQVNPDNPSNILVLPREDWWATKHRIINTGKGGWYLDSDSDIKVKPISELNWTKFEFKYKTDSDYLNNSYESETNRKWGDRVLEINNDFSSTRQSLELGIFSSTPTTNKYTNDRVCPIFATRDSDEFRPSNVNMRLLFYTGLKDCEPWFLSDKKDELGIELTKYPYCGHLDDPDDPRWDLNFDGTEKIYQTIQSLSRNNIFRKFHQATFQQLLNNDNRFMEAFFYLTAKDIQEFDFRDMLEIDGVLWRVNEIIDFNPSERPQSTKVVLYKVTQTRSLEYKNVPVPSSNRGCPSDIVLVSDRADGSAYYKSQSGGHIRETCCYKIGGDFRDGVCYVESIIQPWGETPKGTDVPISGPGNGIPGGLTPQVPGIVAEGIGGFGGPIVTPFKDTLPVVVVGPISDFKDFNSVNKTGVTVVGKGNYVSKDSKAVEVIGNDSSILGTARDSFGYGKGITVDKSKNFYVNDVAIDQDGDIVNVKPYILHGGRNTTLPPSRSNMIEVVHGGKNASRNTGGDSKRRVVINDNEIRNIGEIVKTGFKNGNGKARFLLSKDSGLGFLQVADFNRDMLLQEDELYEWTVDLTGISPCVPIPKELYTVKRTEDFVFEYTFKSDTSDEYEFSSSNNGCPFTSNTEYLEIFGTCSGDYYKLRVYFNGCSEDIPGPNFTFEPTI